MRNPKVEACCDLLEKSYLCGINNNYNQFQDKDV